MSSSSATSTPGWYRRATVTIVARGTRGLLGKKWPKFPDERWINIKNQTAVELIKRRITLANNLGCDAVDSDNIDGYSVDSDDSLPEDESVSSPSLFPQLFPRPPS